MSKTILITGSTDGIGLATAKMLVPMGHKILVHGRSLEKVEAVIKTLKTIDAGVETEGFIADFSDMNAVKKMAEAIKSKYEKVDVLINNAGIFVVRDTLTKDNLEVRFAVNTIAPYLLTKLLMPVLKGDSRVVNLSSAAQTSVDVSAISTPRPMSNDEAYAQSKLALTMWSFQMANDMKKVDGPSIIAVNPKSFLGSKMVKVAYRSEGHDINIGADILCRAALSDEFADASGKYFDNDRGIFSMPHPDALDDKMRKEVVDCLESIVADYL